MKELGRRPDESESQEKGSPSKTAIQLRKNNNLLIEIKGGARVFQPRSWLKKSKRGRKKFEEVEGR